MLRSGYSEQIHAASFMTRGRAKDADVVLGKVSQTWSEANLQAAIIFSYILKDIDVPHQLMQSASRNLCCG